MLYLQLKNTIKLFKGLSIDIGVKKLVLLMKMPKQKHLLRREETNLSDI